MRLTLRVLEATGLSHLNNEDSICPFCLIQLSNSSQIQRTKAMARTTVPVWDEEFWFNVRRQTDSLKIFVKDSSNPRSHVVLSTVALPLRNYDRDRTIDKWFRLLPVRGVKAGGQLHLILRLDTTAFVRRADFPGMLKPTLEVPKHVDENKDEPQALLSLPPPIAPVDSTPPKNVCRVLTISCDFGDVVDTSNPNEIAPVENPFARVRESPAKMYTADAICTLQMEMEYPVYGPHWALAKIAAFAAHQACDYFTDFAVAGCEGATKTWVLNMKRFFSESNHDINRNRISAPRGSVLEAVFRTFDVGIRAMARKVSLLDARIVINEASTITNSIAADAEHSRDFAKAESALLKGCQSYRERDDGAFLKNLEGTKLNSTGLNAAVAAFAISSLEHSLNCYICNSFGSRIVIDPTVREKKRDIRFTTFGRIPLVELLSNCP
jgi:hypothetical protein